VKSQWPVNTEIALRKSFTLPSGASNLRVFAAVDNDVQVLINGIDISNGLVIHDGCPNLNDLLFQAPDSILQSGENLLAVRVRDRGQESFVDVQVVVDMLPLPPPHGNLEVSPSSYDFGDVALGDSRAQLFYTEKHRGCRSRNLSKHYSIPYSYGSRILWEECNHYLCIFCCGRRTGNHISGLDFGTQKLGEHFCGYELRKQSA